MSTQWDLLPSKHGEELGLNLPNVQNCSMVVKPILMTESVMTEKAHKLPVVFYIYKKSAPQLLHRDMSNMQLVDLIAHIILPPPPITSGSFDVSNISWLMLRCVSGCFFVHPAARMQTALHVGAMCFASQMLQVFNLQEVSCGLNLKSLNIILDCYS